MTFLCQTQYFFTLYSLLLILDNKTENGKMYKVSGQESDLCEYEEEGTLSTRVRGSWNACLNIRAALKDKSQ